MGQRCGLVAICLLACHIARGQTVPVPALLSFAPSDSFNRTRFWVATGVTSALYTGTTVALSAAWYKQYPHAPFHFFDDSKEWRGMDKTGHLYTSYFESQWAYHIAKWTGTRETSSVWIGAALGLVFQSTVEVLDGFSAEWGFSWSDMGSNVLGAGIFVTQQQLWGEQRIRFKVSSTPRRYSSTPILAEDGLSKSSLKKRTDDLFGQGYAERFLKDYNAQTAWLSVNISAFLRNPESRFPKWLNAAVGYGADNMFGGFANRWDENGVAYSVPASTYPRYSQFYLAPDVDFSRIPCHSPFLRTLLGMLNIFKMPGPVLEMSREKGVRVKVMW